MDPINLAGTVTPFGGRGRQLGYPTANIKTVTDLKDGVYFGYANLGMYQNRPALVFIGVPVTVGDQERRVEVHLLDIPDQDYYSQPLSVSIRYFHRPNQHFQNIDELTAAMQHDEAAARAWFIKHPLAGLNDVGDTRETDVYRNH